MADTSKAKKRLQSEYGEIGSYDRLADNYRVNVRYVWEFLVKDAIPPIKICKRLKIPYDLPPPSTKLTYTRTRNAQANEVAQHMGYKNWSQLTTVMIDWYSTIKKG
jgi:hypothetical protein